MLTHLLSCGARRVVTAVQVLFILRRKLGCRVAPGNDLRESALIVDDRAATGSAAKPSRAHAQPWHFQRRTIARVMTFVTPKALPQRDTPRDHHKNNHVWVPSQAPNCNVCVSPSVNARRAKIADFPGMVTILEIAWHGVVGVGFGA